MTWEGYAFPGSLLGWSDPAVRQRRIVAAFGALLVLMVIGCTLGPSPYIPLALCALAGIGTIVLLRPHLLLLLVCACTGLPSFVLPLPGHNMHLIEPVSLLCVLVVLVRRLPARIIHGRKRNNASQASEQPNEFHAKLHMPHLLAAVFLALAVISFLHVPEFSVSASGYGADKRLLELFIIFAAFFSGTFLIGYVRDVSSLLTSILFVSIPLYLVGLAQAIGIRLPPLLEAAGAQNPQVTQGRLWGPFPWSVNFGTYLVNLFAVALACWLLGKRRHQRCFGLIMLITTVLEMVGSGTRSIAIAAGIIFIVALLVTRRLKLLCATVMLVGSVVFSVFTKILPLFAHDETSTSNRLMLWNEAIYLIKEHPWIGIGLQQFHYYYGQLIVSRAAELGPLGIHPHEQYLEWAMESGIFWLIIGVLLLLSIVISCAHAYRRAAREQRALLLVALLAVLANIVIGFFDVPLDQLENAVLLFLLAGLACGYAEHIRSSTMNEAHAAYMHSSVVNEAHCTFSSTFSSTFSGKRERYEPRGESSGRSGSVGDGTAPTLQKTSRSIVIQFLSWSLAVPIIIPMTALLTRYLGPVQYGEYSLTVPFLTLFAFFSGTGMDPLLIRQLSCQARATWSETLSYAAGTRLLSTLLSAGTAIGLAVLLPISVEQRGLFVLGSVSLLFSFSFNGLRMIYSDGFRAEQRVSVLSLLELVNRVLTAGLVAVVVLLHLSLLWAYLLLIYSDLPAFLVQMLVACKRFGIGMRFDLVRMREHLLGGLPLVGHNILTLLSGQGDLLILMMWAGPLNVGIYALASRIIDPLISIANAYVNGLYPLFCSTFIEGPKLFELVYREAMRILALIIFPLAIVISSQAQNIVTLLGGQHFAAAGGVVQLLIWAMVATFFNRVCESACTAAHLERKVLFVTGITASLNILANLLLIPSWQIMGAGTAALVSESVGLCLFALLLRRTVRLLPTLGTLALIVLGNLPALALLYWQRATSPFLVVPLALLLSIAGGVATRTLTVRDVELIGRALFGFSQRLRHPACGGMSHAGLLKKGQNRECRGVGCSRPLLFSSRREAAKRGGKVRDDSYNSASKICKTSKTKVTVERG